jgi:hypothetical protein
VRARFTRLNMESMSVEGMVLESFLIKRKPWMQAASRTCWATSGDGLDMSMTGISDSVMLDKSRDVNSVEGEEVVIDGSGERVVSGWLSMFRDKRGMAMLVWRV